MLQFTGTTIEIFGRSIGECNPGEVTMRIPFYIIIPVAILTLVLATFHASATTHIAASAEETNPLQAGNRAPDFTVYNVDGAPFTFNANRLDRPAVIITFRGGWCPFCNAQLQELRNVLSEINKSGVDILFLSGDRPEILYSSLKNETQEFISGLDYTILSDADMTAGIAFGLAFRVPDETFDNYMQRNWDLDASSLEKQKALSVPAVYVVNTNGEITFAYANPDYRVRLPAEDVKAAVVKMLEATR